MTVYILDSSAVLRYIDNEAGAERMSAIFRACVTGKAAMWISALQWGEVAGGLRKRLGDVSATRVIDSMMPVDLEVIPATADCAIRAARLRLDRKISYADCFALDLAVGNPAHVLVTADYDFKPAADLARIEFLPLK